MDIDIIDDTRFKFLLQHREQISIADLEIKNLNNGFIEIAGWKFNVSNTLHPEALVEDVIEGWNLLRDIANVRICSLVFFIRSADDYLRKKLTYDNGFEPDILELLRLCYWYYKCSNLDTVNFDYKVREIYNQLGKKLTDKVSHFCLIDQSSLDPIKFSEDLLNQLSHIENTPEYSDMSDNEGFYKVREDFLEKISSYVSELMICVLLLEANVHPTKSTEKIENERLYDMRVRGIPSDIKTIIDKYPYFDEPEHNLHIEIIQSLKRNKVWEKINEAIEQRARIIFINATVTSLGKAVSKYAGRQRKEIIINVPGDILFCLLLQIIYIPAYGRSIYLQYSCYF